MAIDIDPKSKPEPKQAPLPAEPKNEAPQKSTREGSGASSDDDASSIQRPPADS